MTTFTCVSDISREPFYTLFENFGDSSIFSVLEGKLGHLFADSETAPKSAIASIGDFNFFAGLPQKIINIKSIIPSITDETIIIFQNPKWKDFINEDFQLSEFLRYRTIPPKSFDVEKLEFFSGNINELDGYTINLINEDDYNILKHSEFGKDLTGQAQNYDTFKKQCLGVVIKYNGEIISGTSSYSYYSKGLEIQVETHPAHEGKGLATICSATFILECIKRGLTPHWDAAHLKSLHIAEKLGFISTGEYKAYNIKTKTEDIWK